MVPAKLREAFNIHARALLKQEDLAAAVLLARCIAEQLVKKCEAQCSDMFAPALPVWFGKCHVYRHVHNTIKVISNNKF